MQATEDEVSSDEENDEENEDYLESLEPEKWKVRLNEVVTACAVQYRMKKICATLPCALVTFYAHSKTHILGTPLLQEQDHYKVLGLSKHRYLANEGQIKKACMLIYAYLGCPWDPLYMLEYDFYPFSSVRVSCICWP
jgi:hypothetical protein